MGGLLLLGVVMLVFLPAILAPALRGWRYAAVPGGLALAFGLILAMYAFGIDVPSGHEENPLAGVGEFLLGLAGVAVAFSGGIWLIALGRARAADRRAARPATPAAEPPVGLPPAVVVNDVPKT